MRPGRVELSSSMGRGLAASCTERRSQGCPARPIRLVNPHSAGGGNDMIARPIAATSAEPLSLAVVGEKWPGAKAIIGVDHFAKTAPAATHSLSRQAVRWTVVAKAETIAAE